MGANVMAPGRASAFGGLFLSTVGFTFGRTVLAPFCMTLCPGFPTLGNIFAHLLLLRRVQRVPHRQPLGCGISMHGLHGSEAFLLPLYPCVRINSSSGRAFATRLAFTRVFTSLFALIVKK